MITLSIEKIKERILAQSALHFLTSEGRPGLLTPDHGEALTATIKGAWEETAYRCKHLTSNWNISGDIIEVELAAGYDEKVTRAMLESCTEHLALGSCFGLTYPEAGRRHIAIAERLAEELVGKHAGGKAKIKGSW